MDKIILDVRNLKTYFFTAEGVVKAVDKISFKLPWGKVLGIVGESGCGKTVTALSLMRLVQTPGRIMGGEILFKGEDLLKKSDEEMRCVRGCGIAMIFQDPTSSLNPVFTVGDQIAEAVRANREAIDKKNLWWDVEKMLEKVGISDSKKRRKNYPHQFSGGMRQRAMIAMALSCEPDLLIADEPTTNLDVTTQIQILNLIKDLQKDFDLSVIYVTHDLGVVAEIADLVAVMYAGKIMEIGNVRTTFKHSRHPYTQALLASIPRIDRWDKELSIIRGSVPSLIDPPMGCVFHPRCNYATEVCSNKAPEIEEVRQGHFVACLRHKDLEEGTI